MMSAETIVFVFTDLQQTAFKLLPGLQAEYQSTECHELTDTAIFRFDQREVEKAMAHAVTRGVAVHALIAHTNRAGERNLRRLEMRLLAAGVTVARTADRPAALSRQVHDRGSQGALCAGLQPDLP
jgi:hypothetical protein